MVVLVFGEVRLEEGTGANERHLTYEDVHKLGQLVETPSTQHAAEPSCARVLANLEQPAVAALIEMSQLILLKVCAVTHCPELEHAKATATESRTFLGE